MGWLQEESQQQEALKSTDTNGDGEVQQPEDSPEQVQALFTEQDVDKSQGLNLEEFSAALKKWWGGGGAHYGSASWGHGPMDGSYGHVSGGGFHYGHGGMGWLQEESQRQEALKSADTNGDGEVQQPEDSPEQ